jgi:hypothetical protein
LNGRSALSDCAQPYLAGNAAHGGPSLTTLDVRVSKTVALGGFGRVELLMDVLNAFNQATEEGLATDNLYSPTFGQPDPRRVMLGARLNLGR